MRVRLIVGEEVRYAPPGLVFIGVVAEVCGLTGVTGGEMLNATRAIRLTYGCANTLELYTELQRMAPPYLRHVVEDLVYVLMLDGRKVPARAEIGDVRHCEPGEAAIGFGSLAGAKRHATETGNKSCCRGSGV